LSIALNLVFLGWEKIFYFSFRGGADKLIPILLVCGLALCENRDVLGCEGWVLMFFI